MPRLVDIIFRGQNSSVLRSMEEIEAGATRMGKTVATASESSAAAAMASATRMKKQGEALQTISRTALGLTAPLIGVGVVSGKMAMDFQKSMEMIHTQAGASQKEVDQLSKSVLGLGGKVAQSPKELADGLFHLESMGLRGSKAIGTLKVAADGASIGGASLTDTVVALGSAVAGGVRGTGNFSHAMAIMNAAVGAGDMHMQDFAQAMSGRLIAALKVYGVNLKDAGAALAVFGDMNLRGAAAGTMLSQALRVMAAPSQKAQKEMASIGLGSTDLAEKLRGRGGLMSALKLLADHLSGLSGPQRGIKLTEMFGGKQAQGVMLLLSEMDRFGAKLTKEQQGIANWAEDKAKTQATAAYKLHAAWSEVESSLVRLGGTILPIAATGFGILAKVVSTTLGWFTKLPAPIKDFLGGLTMFVFVGAGVGLMLGKIIKGLGVLREAYLTIKGSQVVATIAAKVFGTTTKTGVGQATGAMEAAMGPTTELTGANARLAASYDAVAGSADAAAASIAGETRAAGAAAGATAAEGGAAAGAAGEAGALGGLGGAAGITAALGTGAGIMALPLMLALASPGGNKWGKRAREQFRQRAHNTHLPPAYRGGIGMTHLAAGGLVPHMGTEQRFAVGGDVEPRYMTRGGPMGTDTVPAWLTPGEGVLSLSAMRAIGGASALNAMNAGRPMPPIVIHPSPATLRIDGRVVAETVIRYVTDRAARGPTSMSGGSLVLGAPGLPATGALRLQS